MSTIKRAFPCTLPVLFGYVFIGLAYGIYMNVNGFSFVYPMLMALIIFGGSLEFIAVSMLLSPFAPFQVFIVALLIQARHLFYGLSMIERYKGMGLKKFYLIYALSDETFSVIFNTTPPKDVDPGKFYLAISVLNQSYWVLGATLGGLMGSLLPFKPEGLSFVMTAMFVAIFMDQWIKEKHHISAYIGLIASVLCLVIFGPDSFMVPTMVLVFVVLLVLKKPLKRLEEKEDL